GQKGSSVFLQRWTFEVGSSTFDLSPPNPAGPAPGRSFLAQPVTVPAPPRSLRSQEPPRRPSRPFTPSRPFPLRPRRSLAPGDASRSSPPKTPQAVRQTAPTSLTCHTSCSSPFASLTRTPSLLRAACRPAPGRAKAAPPEDPSHLVTPVA